MSQWEAAGSNFVFRDILGLLASSGQGLQHELDRFSTVHEQGGIKIITKEQGIVSHHKRM